MESGSAPEDRRPRIIKLTKSGKQLVAKLEGMVASQEENLKSFFSPGEYDQFLQVLEILEQGLQISKSDESAKIEKAEDQ
ncbi:hypothetical protein GALL_467290 [mine drainage metagenome]|uniref:HTH marR-type domain-containing protein n=1 Tax=mine drainage metagenome TaxID=410659 RepID=A0A1J5PLF8_9ZZZZ